MGSREQRFSVHSAKISSQSLLPIAVPSVTVRNIMTRNTPLIRESTREPNHDPAELGELERAILALVWRMGKATAEEVREELDRPLKDSTIRTVLRRLEEKGYLAHRGRQPDVHLSAGRVAAEGRSARGAAHRGLVLRGVGGRAAGGLLDSKVVSRAELERLTKRVEAARKREGGKA